MRLESKNAIPFLFSVVAVFWLSKHREPQSRMSSLYKIKLEISEAYGLVHDKTRSLFGNAYEQNIL